MWLTQEYSIPNKNDAGEAPCELVGEEVQRLSVVQNLPQLLEGNEQLCMQRVVPKVQLALPNASTEFHMAASSTFKTILEKKLVHPRTFTQTFLQSILSSIDSRDPVVANAWLETLLDVIDLLPSDVVKSDILPIAVNKGQISQKLPTRITACKLLGKISTRVDHQTLKKDTLPIILSLCQDVKADVRACICSQLPFVAQGLGAEGLKPSILPLLVELASDEESVVRLSAVEAIVCMLPHLQPDTLKNIIVPLVKKMCESSLRNEDSVMVVLAQVFGELCLGLEGSLTLPERRWLINYYQQLAELGLRTSDRDYASGRKNMPDLVPKSNNADKFVECRHHCAFHFPAMTRFCTGTSDNFEEQLYPVFCSLASDPYFEVRRTIACGLHEITRVLGNSNGMIKSELVKLLRDDSEEVLTGLIPNLSKTLTLLTKSGTVNPDFMDTATLEIGRALLKCESEVSSTNNWRLHESLLQQLECLHQVLPSEFIHSYFTPMLFTRIHHGRQVPVRLAASNALLVFLRYNTKSLQRNDIRSRIISELSNGRSCYSRQSYMRLCSQALDVFSRKYFKEHFYLSALERAEDPVPNIRYMFVRLLSRMKMCLRMPSDKKYFAALEASVRKIISVEKDKDVLAVLDRILPALDKMECVLDTVHVNAQSSREDQEDQRKLEEEMRLAAASGKLGDSKLGPVNVPSAPSQMVGGGKPNATTLIKTQPGRYSHGAVMPSSTVVQKKTVSPNNSRSSSLQRGDPSQVSSPRVAPARTLQRPDASTPRRNVSNSNASLVSSGTPRDKDALKSLEDEFYRDAGIKIPQQFTSSGLPTRIPSVRDSLFKREHTSRYAGSGIETGSKFDLDETHFEECKGIELKGGRSASHVEGSNAFSKVAPSNSSSQKAFGTKVATPKKGFASFSTHPEAEKGSAVDSKVVSRGAGAVVNRRHSYLASEKTPKTNLRIEESNGPHKRTMSVIDNSRRHSYIERLQISTTDGEAKSDSSKRQSFHGREDQSQRGQSTKPAIPLRKNLNRAAQNTDPKPDTSNRRRSMNYTQRDSSTGSERTEFTDTSVKRRSLVASSAVSKFSQNRRHSSLERDDVETGIPSYGRNRTYGSGYANRHSHSPQTSREDLRPEAKRQAFSSDENLYKAKLQRPGYLKNEARNMDFAIKIQLASHGHESKIPRSNNSSPGNSRSSSPCSAVPHTRHLTAPNSRAGSPTAGNKRLSLGSLNSYMSNVKLTEPSSKLPVRKK